MQITKPYVTTTTTNNNNTDTHVLKGNKQVHLFCIPDIFINIHKKNHNFYTNCMAKLINIQKYKVYFNRKTETT